MLLRNRYLGIYVGVTGSEMCKSIEINGVTYISQQYIISEESQLLFFNFSFLKNMYLTTYLDTVTILQGFS